MALTREVERMDVLNGYEEIAAALGITVPQAKHRAAIGANAIGAAIGMDARQVQYLHGVRQLPTFKLGAKVCARRSTLARHFARLEQES